MITRRSILQALSLAPMAAPAALEAAMAAPAVAGAPVPPLTVFIPQGWVRSIVPLNLEFTDDDFVAAADRMAKLERAILSDEGFDAEDRALLRRAFAPVLDVARCGNSPLACAATAREMKLKAGR